MVKKIIFLLLLTIGLAAGCRKDPGAIYRTDSYNSNLFPKDTAQLFSLLVSAYSSLRTNIYGFDMRSHILDCLDHTADLNYPNDQDWLNVTQNNMKSTNSYAQVIWQACYKGVQYCNAFFAGADKFQQTYAKPADLPSVNIMRGEAHFLRALHYFYLECLFGQTYIQNGSGGDQPGVAIITSVANRLDSTQVPRATVQATWAFIVSDLQQAITLLKGVSRNTLNEGRATEWAAKALLGKVYVYTQDWSDAKTVLGDVINNGGYALMPWSQYANAFNGQVANKFNQESIFELDVEGTEGCYGVFCGDNPVTSSEGLVWSPVVLGDDGTEVNPHTTGYANESFHDRNLARFGYHLPVQDLVANPAYVSSQPGSPSNPDSILNPAYATQAMALRTNKTVDPRLYVNGLEPWIDSSGIGNPGMPVDNRVVVRYVNLDHSYYGWSFHKCAEVNFDINNNNAAGTADIYILRLADVFLLYAEACSNSGDNIDALEYINKVKRRAYNYPYNSPSPVDYASLTDVTNAQAGGDPVLGNNPLYYERWAELMNEANWWFDVCRWRIGKSEAAWYVKTFAGGPIQWNDAKSYVLPIPQQEIANNKKMVQNQGYN